MEFSQLIKVRESVRSYDPERPVSRETLLRIFDKCRMAPSAKNLQPWKLLVISDKDLLKQIKGCYGREWLQDAPQILAIVGNRQEGYTRRYDSHCFIETDLAIVMTYTILAAADEGVATCWISNFDPLPLHSALNLSQNEIVYNITPLGYPKADYRPKELKYRKSLDELVIWN